jgi:hypothetical protein
MTMKKALRWLGRKLGIATWYHVAGTYQRDSHMGTAVISLTVYVRPWIHEDNYPEVVAYVESQADKPKTTPCITSITRLGP